MIARLRSLLNTPFARPPGRRSIWARFAPEWCALAVWLLFFGTCLIQPAIYGAFAPQIHRSTARMWMAAPVAYGLGGIILFVLPLIQGAWAWAPERSREAMPVLLTTPLDHRRVAWGRFLNTALPWLRFFCYLLPIYILGASIPDLVSLINKGGWGLGMLCSFAPKPVAVAMGLSLSDGDSNLAFSAKAHGFLALRILNDFSQFFLTVGVAYFFSVLCRTPARALLATLVTVVLFMVTLGAADIWWLVLFEKSFSVIEMTGATVAAVIACSLIPLRLILSLVLVGWAARRFDAWALEEKPGP